MPNDYKEFINGYGSGLICDFLEIYNPFASEEYKEIAWFKAIIGMFEVFTIAAPLFPQENGLLPCGVTHNGGLYIMWKTTPKPDEWTIALVNNDSRKITFLDCNLTDFIIKFIRNEFSEGLLNYADLKPCTGKFKPFK